MAGRAVHVVDEAVVRLLLAHRQRRRHFDAERLGGRPFDQDGISYWEADWASLNTGASNAAEGTPPTDNSRYRFLF